MSALWASTSYEPHLLSLPFAFAPAAMLVVVSYGLVMRGEPVLRAWMLVHFLALLPYSVVMMLSPSIVSHEAAEALFRIAAGFIPLAAAAGAGFQFRALGTHRQARWFVWFGVAVGIAWLFACVAGGAVVAGARWLPVGLWYANAGDVAWLTVVSTVVIATPGFVALARRAITAAPSVERRQLRLVLIANVITYAGLTDVALAYEIGVFPLGWLLSGVGSVVVARALVVEDLLRVRAIDTTAPRIVLHLASAILLGWVALHLLGDAPWWMVTLVLAVSFTSVRVALAVIGLIARGARGSEDTLDRLLGQLTARARPLEKEPAIAELGIDVIELGVGVRVDIMIAASDDYGWTTGAGDEIADDAAPDPLLGAWLAEHGRPIFAAELDAVPEDLRELVTALLDKAGARALFPVASQDELLALVLVPTAARRMRRRELGFIERAADRIGEALVHARMAQRAAERAMIARQVELAATLQQQLLPGREPHVHGDITIVGSWLPATRCAGDFWGVYPLGARGVLVAIGDVTGHGVASATVTAAAAAAVDVVVRRRGEALELDELVVAIDAAVHRVGGGELSMTCFAAILDAKLREVSFVSCGHTTPYLCRTGERGELELQALVGRGNPLGTPQATGTKVLHKPLKAGDLVVWYTDGVIEAQDPSGEPFGDRRLQRMLRRLDRAKLTPAAVHDVVYASVAAHRGTTPRADDETLVVAQWAPPPAASVEPSREASA
jgi:serine phosphatase RsbU (regulator of sigma subunit)